MTDEARRYPIGRFIPDLVTPGKVEAWLQEIAELPSALRTAVAGLTVEQLDTPYRDGGWTVRQVVHHVPDSHMNGYIRTCLALTETEPVIRPYEEQLWAELPFMKTGDVAPSLDLLDSIHTRWLHVLRGMSDADWSRRFVHPVNGATTIAVHVQNYAWHGRHHLAHVELKGEGQGQGRV